MKTITDDNIESMSDQELIDNVSEVKMMILKNKLMLQQLEQEVKQRKQKPYIGAPCPHRLRGKPFYTLSSDLSVECFIDDFENREIAETAFNTLNYFDSAESAQKHAELLLLWKRDLINASNGNPIDPRVVAVLFTQGYMVMSRRGTWYYYPSKPVLDSRDGCWVRASAGDVTIDLSRIFNIKPVENWQESLLECGL